MNPNRTSKTVAALLAERRSTVFSVAPGDTALLALRRMAERDVGALVVLEGEVLVGIVSERDCARKLELRGRLARDTPVRDVMETRVLYVAPGHTVGQCMALMRRDRIRHLPVVEGGRVVGVISVRDVLEDAVAADDRLIGSLSADRMRMTTNTGSY